MTILYEVYDNLYVNLTNRCPCACTFCLRQTRDEMNHSGSLWLSHPPTAQEVIDEFAHFDLSRYKEIVFCGFGEPTEALDILLAVARHIRSHCSLPIRINTNGLGNLIHQTSIAPLFTGLIDTVSISLNTPNPSRYLELVRPKFGEISFPSMLDFAKECTNYVPRVVMTTVSTTLTPQEEDQCRAICEKIGAIYRIRPWEE